MNRIGKEKEKEKEKEKRKGTEHNPHPRFVKQSAVRTIFCSSAT